MKNNIAIEVKDVSMCFNMSKEKVDSLKEYFIKLATRKLFYEEFWALKNISFEVKKGEVLGIFGLNGAGKSTLLKVIAGVLKPTKGEVKVHGTIAPLIELGAGFDFDLTARENIFLNGAILGYSRKFIEEKFDEIVEFSELKDFLDVPIKNFSSGMIARLGFSIATVVEPDILLVDEILSVGDYKFKEKCEIKIRNLIGNGTTIIIVSHSINLIKNICENAILLQQGTIKLYDKAEEICTKII